MTAFIALGEAGLAEARRVLMSGAEQRVPLVRARLAAPIPRPARNIFCVGKNYREHVQELPRPGSTIASGDALPEAPIFFTKATSSVIGPHEPM